MGTTERSPRAGRWATLAVRWLAALVLLVVVACGAIAVALQVTPMQTVTVAGQVIRVGATSPDLSWSGPGEVDLFGQSLPTNILFSGPVRPRLQLSQITINSELTTFVEGRHGAGAERILGARLADGWKRYFIWETAIVGAGTLILVGALAGWRRLPSRTTVKLLAAGLLIAEALNVGAIMITTYTAPDRLRQVHSLNELVGSLTRTRRIHPAGHPLRQVQAVVIGDSTAAGAGLAPAPGVSGTARACGRSADSYAADLSDVNGWRVLNLACNSATIRHGLLGPQEQNGTRLPPQLAEAERASRASVVSVSVGADALNWAADVPYCSVTPNSNDRATAAYFQQQRASFSKDYLDLLSRLAVLPGHPQVIINRYYNPFGAQPGCLSRTGLTQANLQTLTSRLATLNTVLAKGAAQFQFSSPQPDFAGHQLCTALPYVQGLSSPTESAPTVLGQLAIALADQAALDQPGPVLHQPGA